MTNYHQLINYLALVSALLSAGVIYGTDMFFAIVFKKAAAQSRDESIADVVGHTHLVADKRMPFIGVVSILSTGLFTVFNVTVHLSGQLTAIALFCLLAHLGLYLKIAKPINSRMSAAIKRGTVPADIRQLQQQWDRIIGYRASLLTIAMLLLIIAALNTCV